MGGLTHVIRGEEHLRQTPGADLIYQAMDGRSDLRHLPLTGRGRRQAVEAHGAQSVGDFMTMGYCRDNAQLSGAARLGHGERGDLLRRPAIECST